MGKCGEDNKYGSWGMLVPIAAQTKRSEMKPAEGRHLRTHHRCGNVVQEEFFTT